jgi:hypothetical protein
MRAWIVVVGLAACGGGGKKETALPVDDGGGGGGAAVDTGADDMVPPEKMDEIQVRLDRKRGLVARCLSDAVLAGTAPRNARGKITLEFVISPGGQAERIKVAKASLQVKEIGFPELPRALEWSYTFAFESM